MVGTKKRTCYRKKRKMAFSGTRKHEKHSRVDVLDEDASMPGTSQEFSLSSQSMSSENEALADSASRRKLIQHGYRDDQTYDESGSELSEDQPSHGEGYRLVDLKCLSSCLSNVHKCQEGDLCLKEATSKAGLKPSLSVECSSCHKSTKLDTSNNIHNKGRSFDVNRRAVFYSLETGSGYQGLTSFCSIMNMPCMSKGAYYKQVEIILEAQEEEALQEMNAAGQRLCQIIVEQDEEISDTGIVDVAVSFDGTWAKRGFTSLTGIVFVMG